MYLHLHFFIAWQAVFDSAFLLQASTSAVLVLCEYSNLVSV